MLTDHGHHPPHQPPPPALPPRRLRLGRARGRAVAGAVGFALAGLVAAIAARRADLSAWIPPGRLPVAADDRAQMTAAEQVIDSLHRAATALDSAGSPRSPLTGAALIALAYHERLRIGAGSPFRLADYALHDPRLVGGLGRTTAWSILARTARGESHEIDPTPLAGSTERDGWTRDDAIVPATRQRALIDSVVARATNARTGEAAVRLALTLAESERLLDRRAAAAAVNSAALARDRRLVTEDARRLLAESKKSRDDALTVLQQWRAARRFTVELPLLADALQPAPDRAAHDALRLLALIRESARLPDPLPPDSQPLALAARAFVARGFLPPTAARQLGDAAAVRSAPPQAPVAVAAAAARRGLDAAERAADQAATDPRSPDERAAVAARRRFVDRLRTEESLVAEQAIARAALLERPRGRAVVAAESSVAELTLAAAVALRAYGQESVWFPELGAPDESELRSRFGLLRVAFDPSIPAGWRPYYRHVLASALTELRGILPSLSFAGLSVRIGESAKRDSALALHDPSTRTVYLPAGSGAGTIAHEIAHDLDWQTASARLALRGTYSTDRAARDVAGTAPASLTRSVRGLTAARPRTVGSAGAEPPERPAELFARGVDWFAAAALAREGRMNGYLTSVQDAALPGYAGVIVPEPGDRDADAVVDVLEDMTILPWVTRAWYLGRFGELTPAGPDGVVRHVLTAGPHPATGAPRGLRALDLSPLPVARGLDHTPSRRALLESPACERAAREPWRAELLWAAAESRARGTLRLRARRWAAAPTPAPWLRDAQATLGGPWEPERAADAVHRARDAILREVAREDEARGPAGRTGLATLVYGGCR